MCSCPKLTRAMMPLHTRNRLFNSLSDPDRALLIPNLVSKSFRQHHHFEREGKAFDHVCFPETLVASIVASQGDIPIEIGLIGCEGMTGMAAVLGTGQSPNATFVQIAGEGLVISITDFTQALNQSASMRSALLRYFPVLTLQTAHTAIANSVGKLPIRLARWLLMAHDRVNGDELVLTHQFMALMLAVRRAGVTEAVNDLQKRRLIKCSRGVVTVLDRKGLEKIAGKFYGKPEAEYRRLIGNPTAAE